MPDEYKIMPTSMDRQAWDKIRDVIGGEDIVKNEGTKYLPQPSGMDINAYNSYKKRASLYSVAGRTISGLSESVLRNPPVIEVPARMDYIKDVFSVDGLDLNGFVGKLLNEILSVGRGGILIDFVVSDNMQLPGVTFYSAENIEEIEIIENKPVMIKINERGTEIILEITDGIYSVSQKDNDGHISNVVPMVMGHPLNFIPFFIAGTESNSFEVERPPLLDLVNLILAHYRNSADYEHALFMTAQPTPWIAGHFNDGEVPTSIGSSVLWRLPEGASAGMLEFSGNGIEAQRQAMIDKEERMLALGARMIGFTKNRNEALDTARMRGSGEKSILSSAVLSVETVILKILKIIAEWLQSNPDDVVFKLNRDWVETRMSPQEIRELVASWMSGAISRDTLHSNLQQGEIIDTQRTVEEEVKLIDSEKEKISIKQENQEDVEQDGV